MNIEDALEGDLAGIAAIYNDAIARSTAVFSDVPVTVEQERRWMAERRAGGFPVLVARERGEVLAFATFGEFRPSPGYRSTVEHSVYVAAGARRRGIGRALLAELVRLAREHGMHAMIAAIDAANEPSLRLHEQFGFEQVGRLPQVARKFDRWLDLALLQLIL